MPTYDPAKPVCESNHPFVGRRVRAARIWSETRGEWLPAFDGTVASWQGEDGYLIRADAADGGRLWFRSGAEFDLL